MADQPASGADPAELRERLDELQTAMRDLSTEFDEKVRDVRERVVQVKLETDAKAPAEHDHAPLEEAVDELRSRLDGFDRDQVDVDAVVDDLEERLGALEDRMEAGFANFEEVLEYLLDATDDAEAKVATLARATMALRTQVDRLAAATAEREAADRLRASAHEHGVTAADCESCGGTVNLAMLTGPECPHCAAGFTEVEPRRGFFRSSVLHTGTRPALEGDVADGGPDLEPLVREAGGDGQPAGDPPGDGPTEPRDGSTPTSAESDASATASSAGSPGDGSAAEALDAVAGVGPAYAERLRDAGLETVGDLAGADPARLAGRTDIAPGRMRTLVDRARDRVGSESASEPASE